MIGDDIVELDADGAEVDRIHLWKLLNPRRHAICPFERRWEWTHANSIDVTADGGIVFSARSISLVGGWTAARTALTHRWGGSLAGPRSRISTTRLRSPRAT